MVVAAVGRAIGWRVHTGTADTAAALLLIFAPLAVRLYRRKSLG